MITAIYGLLRERYIAESVCQTYSGACFLDKT